MTSLPANPSPPTIDQRLAERDRPDRAAVMFQRWEQLAFLHWRYDRETIQRSLPAGLSVDTFQGEAWVGLVPVFMRDVRPRFVPAIPWVSDFLELNLRTYVYDGTGRPGVYFYSLACNQALVVEGARRLLGLNYRHADMDGNVGPDQEVKLEVRRRADGLPEHFVYRATGGANREADVDSLEFFLIERYRLFNGSAGAPASIQLAHAPYQIHDVMVSRWSEHEFELAGLPPPRSEPHHVCGAATVELEVFLPEQTESA